MNKIAYWNISIDTKINLSDTFLSELKYKFISQKIKQGNRESLIAAMEFDRNIYDIKQVFLKSRNNKRYQSLNDYMNYELFDHIQIQLASAS